MQSDYTYVRAVHGLIHRTPAYRQPLLVNHLDQQVELSPNLGIYEVVEETPIDLSRGFSTAVVEPDPLYGRPIYRHDTDVLVINHDEGLLISRKYPETRQAFFEMEPSAGTNDKIIYGIQATLEELELWLTPLREVAERILYIHLHGWLINVVDKEKVINQAFQLQRTAFWNEDLLYLAAAAIRLIDEPRANQLLEGFSLKDKDKYFHAGVKLLEETMKINPITPPEL